MFPKKLIVLVLIALTSTLLLSFKGSMGKKVIGHWTSETDLYDMKVNDTLIFTKTKNTDNLYQWAGAVAGIEFSADRNFAEFHNVLCSSETSPLRYNDEKWTLHNDLITISGAEREEAWRIMNVTSKKMTIVVLKNEAHEH